MEQNDSFKMTYSAQQQEEIRSIREKYTPPQADKMARLRALDSTVTRKATAASLAVGLVGALLLGVGMSLIMSTFGDVLGQAAVPVGIAVGVLGIVGVLLAYPLYNRTLRRERQRVAPEILRLTDELLK